MTETALRQELFDEIFQARQRVYAVGKPTPLERVDIGSDAEVWIKREDQPPIHAYKWRGAYNRMATLSAEQLQRGVVCASAGNHAQGVALAAARLSAMATIFMPRPTPMMKRLAVAKHGGDAVTIELVGDTYDQAYAAAKAYATEHELTFVHPYDDLVTMGGQGTLADEIVMSGIGTFDVAYLQIGGGGMAAAVACWLKHSMPNIHLVGVEAVGQASMQAAVANGGPVTLDSLDIFCDGTAVQRTGDLTYPLCRDLIDEFITVTNQEVSGAIRQFWNWRRSIVEPAGALGLAGLLAQRDRLAGKRVLAITCGANMDFSQLAVIAAESGVDGERRHHLRFTIPEQGGSLLGLIREVLAECNIIEFQYGKQDRAQAFPVIGFDAPEAVLEQVLAACERAGIAVENVSNQDDVQFRTIAYRPDLIQHPLLLRYEFPERAGALLEFMQLIEGQASLCYFNYQYTGERVGRALVGLEFASEDLREAMRQRLATEPTLRERHQLLSSAAVARVLGRSTD